MYSLNMINIEMFKNGFKNLISRCQKCISDCSFCNIFTLTFQPNGIVDLSVEHNKIHSKMLSSFDLNH